MISLRILSFLHFVSSFYRLVILSFRHFIVVFFFSFFFFFFFSSYHRFIISEFYNITNGVSIGKVERALSLNLIHIKAFNRVKQSAESFVKINNTLKLIKVCMLIHSFIVTLASYSKQNIFIVLLFCRSYSALRLPSISSTPFQITRLFFFFFFLY